MSCVKSFISEHAVNREEFHWLELALLGELVEHLGADGGGMSAKDIFHGFFAAPSRSISKRSWQAVFMGTLHASFVLFWHELTRYRTLAEESVLEVTRWMTLWLEKSVKVPERGFNPTVHRHFIKAHRNKDLAELTTHLKKRV